MKKSIIKKIYIIISFSILVVSCADKAILSESTALSAIETYLKTNPIYETTNVPIGNIKFNARKDVGRLNIYKDLSSKGFVDMVLEKQKKKFLSKDSIYTYNIRLTDKASPYIFKQKKEKAEVKSFEYFLNENEEVKIELIGKRSGNAVVSLKKVKTDFAPLALDNNPHTSFITKKFKLRYKQERGWEVVK